MSSPWFGGTVYIQALFAATRHSGKKNPVPSIPQIRKCFFEEQGVISFKLWILTLTLSGGCPVQRASHHATRMMTVN
jgi:hypothetical protein